MVRGRVPGAAAGRALRAGRAPSAVHHRSRPSSRWQLDFPYAFDGPRRFDEPGSYADESAAVEATATVEYAHSLGEIVTAAVGAGLRVDALTEHLDAALDGRGDVLTREADGRYRLRIDGEPLPVLFTLLASRPA